MGNPKSTAKPLVVIKIADGPDIGTKFTRLEWSSFINGGYIIHAQLSDPNFNLLKDLATKGYLKDGRKKPTDVNFQIQWAGGDKTDLRLAYMTDMELLGITQTAELDFIAMDPPSWLLNAGKADGKAYKGKVSDVIKKVVGEYAPGIDIKVTDTIDNDHNIWYMMRQDPQTFIKSLLDWSPGVTPQHTHWVVASVDTKLIIKEQADLTPHDFGVFYINRNGSSANDAIEVEMLTDNFVSPLQTKLITAGISAISGEYLDKVSDMGENKVFVKDKTTPNKVNVNIGPTQGFKKPEQEWATSVMAIPEHSAGDVGVPYSKYIDGRARGLFLNMLNLVMRVRIRVTGDAAFHDSSQLGVSTATLSWTDLDGEPYFLSGRWLVYGFHHIVTQDSWWTDVYLARLDYDATAKKV